MKREHMHTGDEDCPYCATKTMYEIKHGLIADASTVFDQMLSQADKVDSVNEDKEFDSLGPMEKHETVMRDFAAHQGTMALVMASEAVAQSESLAMIVLILDAFVDRLLEEDEDES